MRLSQENEDCQRTPSPQETAACRAQETDNSLKKLRFPKSSRLLKSDDFQRLKRYGKKIVGQVVVFNILSEKKTYPKLGLTVSRQFGKAHLRNQFKRRVREAFRLSQHQLPTVSIHVLPKQGTAVPTLQDLLQDFMTYAK
jgi:ribonuclease P protein component